MRPIDADKAEKLIWDRSEEVRGKEPYLSGALAATIGFLYKCETIDAVPVVRCKVCKNEMSTEKSRAETGCLWCKYKLQPCNENDFCSHGEMREQEEQ